MTIIGHASYCLTQASRPDRQQQALDEFKKNGVISPFFYALDGKDPLESFNRSMQAIIAVSYNEGVPTVSVFEDDVIFKNTSQLANAIMELPYDWDMLYLGANITQPPIKYSDNLCKLTAAWTSHAIIYSRKCIQTIFTNYYYGDCGMYDDWLSRKIIPLGKSFVVNPMICWQRPGKSDLWNRETDYTSCFEAGDKIMREL